MAGYEIPKIITDAEGDSYAQRTANHVKTEGGVWVPQAGTDEGAVKTEVTGSVGNVVAVDDTFGAPGGSTRRFFTRDISQLKDIVIYFRNVEDEGVHGNRSIRFRAGGYNIHEVSLDNLEPGAVETLTSDDIPFLKWGAEEIQYRAFPGDAIGRDREVRVVIYGRGV